MQDESRFDCPSTVLVLKHLLRRTSRILWTALGMTLIAHGMLTLWRGTEQKTHAAKPLTTQFVKRQPRLTKPLELKRRPQPKSRRIQRRMLTVQARVNRQQVSSSIKPVAVVQSLARPQASIGRPAAFAAAQMEPSLISQAIGTAKEDKNVVDMSLEMVDVTDLDTGQYQAMVIQDPHDRRSIQGFFHFAYAYSVTMRSFEEHGDTWRPIRGIRHLLRAVNKYTNIQCDLVDGYTYDSRKLFLTPVVPAVTRWPFKLTESEATNLGQYLMLGGFLFVDPTYSWSLDLIFLLFEK